MRENDQVVRAEQDQTSPWAINISDQEERDRQYERKDREQRFPPMGLTPPVAEQ